MHWNERYRPEGLEDVIGQDHIVDRLRFMVERTRRGIDDWPHMLFAGPAGTGKTSTAYALMKDLFGESWDANFIELNASDERSISVIRTKVKDFAKRGTIGTYDFDGEARAIPFNVVFLDEADNLTPDAQASLRRIMERYKQTRFILSCNYPHKLIAPVKDRCAFSMSRFRPIDDDSMRDYLDFILKQNGWNVGIDLSRKCCVTKEALNMVIDAASGSLRTAQNLLFVLTRARGDVTDEDVSELVVTMQPKQMKSLLAAVVKANDYTPGNAERQVAVWRGVDSVIDDLAARGVSAAEMIDSLLTLAHEMPLPLRRRVLAQAAEALHYASTSQDQYLSVKAFLRQITIDSPKT